MDATRLQGEQYVRLAPGAAEKVAPYLGVAAGKIDELVLSLPEWPEGIHPQPRRGHDGRLIAGDPVLLDVSDAGLWLADAEEARQAVLVRWEEVTSLQMLGMARPSHPRLPRC